MMSAQRSATPISRGMAHAATTEHRGTQRRAIEACRKAGMPSILLGRRDNFKPGPPFIGLWGFGLKDLSRRANKLRRRVYREMPVASGNRTAELDHRMCYADIAAILEAGRLGVSSAGAALALWRACSEHGLRAWCYRFGFPESLTQTVTIVDIDGVLQIHDAFFNLSYPSGLYDVLASLRNGETVAGKRAVRDRKVYIMDPAREPGGAARWLQEHADRELEPVDGLRRFELLWDPEAFVATRPAIEPVFRDLAARGYPADLQFSMLHPVAIFDGTKWHRDRADMPLLRGYNLASPAAALRVALCDLETERARLTETAATMTRLEADLGEASRSPRRRCDAFRRNVKHGCSRRRRCKPATRPSKASSRRRKPGSLQPSICGPSETVRSPSCGPRSRMPPGNRSSNKTHSTRSRASSASGTPHGIASKPKFAICGRSSKRDRARPSSCAGMP